MSGDGGATDGGTTGLPPDVPVVPATKVDILFAVDNSFSMGTKQRILASSAGRILHRLAEPTGDHAPVKDIHVGVVSSSLGTPGGDICPTTTNPRNDDRGHLLTGNSTGGTVAKTSRHFLSLGDGHADALADANALEASTKELIEGAGANGCGYEAQLESVYRFLIQPDPAAEVKVDPATHLATLDGVDDTVLADRKAFLRPDSAVVVVMLTDEDESAADPLAFGGRGGWFVTKSFPGSNVGAGIPGSVKNAPRGTSTCDTDPASPQCVSCVLCEGADCDVAKNDANCKTSGLDGQSGVGYDGYFGAGEDSLNIRFWNMKQRFGVDARWPLDRYVSGFSRRTVPNRDTEHAANAFTGGGTCTNPLFAASLPGSSTEELCALPEGTRARGLVFFALVGGVPDALASGAVDWTKVVGAAAERFDLTGIDPHMIPARDPRPGLSGADAARDDLGSDPINGREWNTEKSDLQFACTFDLPVDLQQTCLPNDGACDCRSASALPPSLANPPLCGGADSATVLRGKAYPTVTELRLAKELGDRAVVGSICRVDYSSTMDGVSDRLAAVLAK